MTKHGLGWLVSQLESGTTSRRALGPGEDNATRKQAEHLRLALVELGVTFIKLGQALSTRPDLLPPVYITELSKLQDEVPPVPFAKMEAVLEQSLGKGVDDLFEEFDRTPMASASIGQVYAAQLKNGKKVVVKIRRPGVQKQVEQDLEILANIAEWASDHTPLGKLYDLPTLLGEFAFRLRNELDYIREGQNANIFRKNFVGDSSVYIPYIYWDLTTTQVITMERVYGIKISDVEKLRAEGINLRIVAENSGRFTLRQLFEFGFFHADPHPGNFFVQPDGSLAVVDFGMVGRLSNKMRDSLLRMVMAMARGDTEQLVDELMEAGVTRKPVAVRALALDLEHLFESYAGGTAQFLSATQVMNAILGIVFRYNMQLPGELTMLVRLSTINEGISMTLYPEFRMLDFAAPYVLKFWQDQRAPDKLALKLGQSAFESIEMGLSLPRQISRLTKRLERGHLEFGVNMDGLKDFGNQMQKMTNRLAMSILLAAVIVALGIVMVVYHPQQWQTFGELLFGFAFLSSLAFGAYLMWSIWRSGGNK